ncbi:MAG: Rrf2 family transcriptional regulator [Dehalococcoidia bacterium]|jgi:Rrf2 family protein|nr:Rrf2 family transcriptional regulator [Dehalococcoidia bacterium]MDP7083500.1 Rrf2 family transcriptional regulator [Dehalococcoidia bacterium]MDP7199405.1 Rrf2 family transcriptional regulator [Dehalococcoidia bacterium]
MKVDYGVRAMVELALHYGKGQIQTADIASKQGIPEAYLDQLMTSLHKFGLVISRRGPQGGHRLAMDPSEIDLHMVMSTLDGSISPLDCLIHPNDCIFSETCAQQEVWKSVEDAVRDVLRNISLADLAQRHQRLAKQPA